MITERSLIARLLAAIDPKTDPLHPDARLQVIKEARAYLSADIPDTPEAAKDTIEELLTKTTIKALCERLRGKYRIVVDDGAGPLDGSYEFVREFSTGPIMHAAAHVIETQASILNKITPRPTKNGKRVRKSK